MERRFIEEPTCCPVCNYQLEKVNDQLFCRNLACPAQIAGKVQHFAKTLGIKGLGPKTIEKLGLQELTEIFYLDPEEVASTIGDKLSEKLFAEIEKSKGSDLAKVLASFSIPLIGETASKKLSTVVSSIDEITPEICKSAGLGEKATNNLINWIETEYKEIKDFLPFTFNTKPIITNTTGKRVCITGKLKSFKTKSEAEKALTEAGYIYVDSVTKNTDILVDEEGKNSSKKEKAISYGITIITDLNDLLN